MSAPHRTIYPIGRPGQAWGAAEKAAWLARQQRQRCYADLVLKPLRQTLPAAAELIEYGRLDYCALGLASYPLLAVKSRVWRPERPTVLITGGVHGYETSGVLGALQFIAHEFARYAEQVNLLVLPCISPWGFETINRWNPLTLDPNRHFYADSPAQEAAAALACVATHAPQVALHIDMHETTDTDNSEFGPAKAARDGVAFDWHAIPDGFYLVGDSERPAPEFQRALIAAVSQVTHIALPDAQGCLIGEPLQQHGVINYAKRELGLCGGMTAAALVTTTEVYPDSPSATPAQCNAAQVATLNAGIDYLLAQHAPPA
ncbi:succinylglutamate desuccinylase/aspartoacylase family protein [Chitinibacter sp. ZOR0017]|uniref:succinylglutamate desuccinylase/aspartoacylase domain-containing protein n=1 Tax=Chitinibacter sp. ZOR0017 TaxID=1339254 RepID=UPI0006476C16|nr:succinylglutamate desuccinylase/aspartoacylase family protein [Chitinibacter sp. ZOR0017]